MYISERIHHSLKGNSLLSFLQHSSILSICFSFQSLFVSIILRKRDFFFYGIIYYFKFIVKGPFFDLLFDKVTKDLANHAFLSIGVDFKTFTVFKHSLRVVSLCFYDVIVNDLLAFVRLKSMQDLSAPVFFERIVSNLAEQIS